MKKCVILGAVLALVLGLVACGGGDSSDGGGGSAATAAGSSESYPELRVSSPPVRRADVQSSFDFPTMQLVAPVSQGLLSYDEGGRLVPALAESFEQVDDTTWSYTLRPEIRFSDGRPLTVDDVVWSLKRNMARDANTLSNYTNVKSIEAQGDDTVVINLKRPDVTFANVPAFSGQIIQKAAAVAGGVDKVGTPSNLPVGTGPYTFESFNPDVGATYGLNSHWSGDKPTAQKLTVKFLRDDTAASLAMRSGEVDVVTFLTSARSFQIPGVNLVSKSSPTQVLISLNTIAAPFDDVHVRRAIAYATDREGIAQVVYDGEVTTNEGLTPANLYGNIAPPADVDAMFASLPRYDYDIEAAKAEMAKSRHPDGFTTTFPASPTGSAVRVAQAMAPDLEQIGIKIRIDEMTDSEYLALLYGPRERLGILVDHYGATFPDPSALLTYWLDPAQAVVNGLNSANWRNAEVGDLLAEQRAESDGAKRLDLLGEIQRIAKEEVPYVPLYSPNASTAVADGFVFEDLSQWTSGFSPWPLLVKKAS